MAGFPWSECQVRKLATSHCITNIESTRGRNNVCKVLGHTREKCTVTACRTELKCEKEATFFMASQVMRITLKAYDHQISRFIRKKNHRDCKEKRITGERTGAAAN